MTTVPIVVDHTHVGRHVTGIERVTLGLFSDSVLAPHPIHRVNAKGRPSMIAAQQMAFWRIGKRDPAALFIFAGFPPSPLSCALGDRCLMYVHDTFPLTRPAEIGWKARLYTAPTFRHALRRLRRFFVNSLATARELRGFVAQDAEIALLRPPVPDVFSLSGLQHEPLSDAVLRLLAIGTIEPRKNYPAAIAVARALNAAGRPAELHIVGRIGWGSHPWLTEPPPFVRVHGYVADEALRALIARSDWLISTSKAEGLGLPLLEVQHGGLPVAAPGGELFDEVLNTSGLPIDPGDPPASAARIIAAQGHSRKAARDNVTRWNALAALDTDRFRSFIDGGPFPAIPDL